MKKTFCILLLIAPTLAFAGEAEVACDLAKSQAEVSATILASPQAFVSIGNQATTQQTASAGISQSFSGILRASYIRDAAQAQCKAIKAALALDNFTQSVSPEIIRRGAAAELVIVDEAAKMARDNIKLLDQQLAAQTITIVDHTAATTELSALENHRASLLRILAVPRETLTHEIVSELIASYKENTAKAAELTAKATADSAWDIALSAGELTPIDGGNDSSSAFITASVKYSFGERASRRAAEDVGRNTALLTETQRLGYQQILTRQKKELQELINAEVGSVTAIGRELNHIKKIRDSLANVDSALGKNTLRNVDLQLKLLEADFAGAHTRLTEYRSLIEQLK
jgi:hypothetical protein